ERSGDYIPQQVQGHFVLKNVEFTYPNGTKALHNVSFEIPANQTTAVVGLSGAGKSTIINLLDKLYEPNSGIITLDGKNIEDYNTFELRKNIGLVLQKNHIFKGSIAENIRYGRPSASQEEVIQAAKSAYI